MADGSLIALFAAACIAFPFILRRSDSKRRDNQIAHKEAKK